MRLPRPLLHPALAGVAAALLAASPAAQAGFQLTMLDPDAGGVLPIVRTGPLDNWQALSGSGQLSTARYVEGRLSRLVDPAVGGPVLLDEVADSGWHSSTTAHQAVSAYASVDLEVVPPGGIPSPARARSAPFENHLQAHSGQRLRMENDVSVVVSGVEYAPLQLYRYGRNTAYAGSAWYDTWQAQQQASTTLTLQLDGSLSHDPGCLANCLLTTPAGITRTTLQKPQMDFEANFTVLDLDTLVSCDDPDECAGPGLRPMAVAMARVLYVAESGASFPQALDLPLSLSFEALAGHRYLAIGSLQAEAINGGRVSFYNSLRLTGVQAPAGTLLSTALGGADLAGHFAQPVPEPASLLLWAAGLAGLAAWRRRAG